MAGSLIRMSSGCDWRKARWMVELLGWIQLEFD
uniref:Uncharacterized protein n=1 Tax=Peronospora matthiolae TaxID=2874970 RepID=A0AAV1U8I2_9STRA